jgi:hypothetical protein
MNNFWLARKMRRRINNRLVHHILRCMRVTAQGRPYVVLDDVSVGRAVDYTVELVERVGYTAALDDIEKMVETAITIDGERFLRKNPRA